MFESVERRATVADLPTCAAENAGERVFVEDEKMLYTCGEEGWTPFIKSAEKPDPQPRRCGADVVSEDSVSRCGEDGTFRDSRNGRIYKCVKIGDQIWMAENLDFGETITSNQFQAHASAAYAQRFCFGDDTTNCAKYGGLYQWATAMGLCAEYESLNADVVVQMPHHRGICPAGWHVPTKTEWEELVAFVQPEDSLNAGHLLKSREGWGDQGSITYQWSYDTVAHQAYAWSHCVNLDCDLHGDSLPHRGAANAGSDAYGWNALPGGHYLRTTRLSSCAYDPFCEWVVGEFVAGETFFWSSTQRDVADQAVGFGLHAEAPLISSAGKSSTPSVDPLYADPLRYKSHDSGYGNTWRKTSGSKTSGRYLRCVQD